ncbi:sedoheptulose 7-phosphate cyclase [Nocardia suismassiliense]|uniref:2-epi-5-epi-valiolone synthase n=1 Tax=Nocardia suismassiliense TaxID=2077092 RepID=A0ABW6QTA4_9NOCA
MERLWAVSTTQSVSYSIKRTRRCLDLDNRDLANAVGTDNRRTLVVVDSMVMQLYGPRIAAYFDRYAANWTVLPVEASERRKNDETTGRILREFDRFGLSRRRDAVVAIGGGVLTDLVGFAASLYRRGVPYLRVPTTLLGMVDASVGVKTGINFNGRKNRLGTYFPASQTIVDPEFLATLPDRQIANGMAEVIKIALVKDSGLFDSVDRDYSTARGFATDATTSGPIIDAAITAILEELEHNLWEANLRRLADFGHTFSPGFELRAQPLLYHGEAVAIDIALTCLVARNRALIDEATFSRIVSVLTRIGLPISHGCITDEILQAGLADSVLHRDGAQNIPLLTRIGAAVFAQDISPKELVAAAESLRSLHSRLIGAWMP